MNSGRFFMPNMNTMPFMRPGINTFMGNSMIMPRNTNVLGRLASGIKSFNWRGLLSGANKTLDVVNQTIPLIKQAKPMVGNVKSMIQLAKAFGKETKNGSYKCEKAKSDRNEIKQAKDRISNNQMPTFFI